MNLLVLPRRLISATNALLCKQTYPKFLSRQLQVSTVINMAPKKNVTGQSKMTSFFNVSPPKKAAVKDEKIDAKVTEIKEEEPPANGEVMIAIKRKRLASSGSESELLKSPKVTSEKKKKKRQRIESSESESELNKSDIQPATPDRPIKKVNDSQSSNSSPDRENSFKVEKAIEAKTYESPKSKKIKTNILTESKKTQSPKEKSSKKNIKKGKSPQKSPFSKNNKIKNEVACSGDEASPDKSKENVRVKEEKADSKKEVVEKVLDTEYNPTKPKYHPINDACWSAGQPVPYLALARTLEAIEGTSARLKIVETLANYLRSVIALTPEDLLPSVYMCLNKLAPAYESVELGIAETYLMKAVGACTGRSLAQVRAAAARAGDLGAAAAAARATQRTMFATQPLACRKVFAALKEIAHMTGTQSVNKKISKIQTLFVACRQSEAKFLIRSLEGKLRIGLAEQSVLQALAVAAATTPPDPAGVTVLDASKGLSPEAFKSRVDEYALTVKTTYCECPNYELVVGALLQHGVPALPQHCTLSVGIPLKPMLAHPTKGVHEVFNRFEGCEFTCEWKYDGERAQIHVPSAPDGSPDLAAAAVFSRNQENNTSKYPDVLGRLRGLLKESVSSCVLDCEAVAYDTDNKQILPFQILSTRKRKGAVESEIKVQVCVFVFDLLLLNGRPLVRAPLRERRALLREHFNTVEGAWQFAESRDCSSMEEVQQFLEESVRGSCEGLMVKTLAGDQAKYDIARRSHNWLKLKKDYLEGVGDTIDVVIIGAYRGRGKRHRTYGGFLAAARDADSDSYQALCKLGTGFSDEDLVRLSAELDQHRIDAPRTYYSFDPAHAADAWFAAACVWEVRCADLSLSPAHRAAIGRVEPDKGISLRFPRFVRVREDKTAEQATSSQQIAEMYLAQDQVKNQQANKPALNYDDFY